ncbi:MAG TPA: hypothetical protein VI818_04300 [Candidatus Thermoplasmatota archaeon]|nr:hypothetical protein [Candidatus Thermoplasmatota archaeon]
MKALTFGIATLLLVGLTIPVAMAHPDDRPALREARKADGGLPAEKRRDANRTNFTIAITATGVDRDNQTYTLEATGRGIGKSREGDNQSGFHGFAKLHVRVLDANGSLVKEGDIRVVVVAHQDEDGEWKWRIVSFLRTPRGMPKLVLRGENGTIENGVGDLEGQGFATFKPLDADKRIRVKLDATVHVEKA